MPHFNDGSTSQPAPLASVKDAEAQAEQMTPAAINYLNSSPESYLDCREGRHDYPRIPPSKKRFTRTSDGYDVYVAECRCCHVAFREELWIIREDVDGYVLDMRLVKRTTKYRRLGDDEPAYLMEKGGGAFSATHLHEMRVAAAFYGSQIRRTNRKEVAETA